MRKLIQPSAPAPTPEPPSGLSERAATLWRAITPRRACSPERLALLEVALRALDRASAAQAEIARDGMVFKTASGAFHAHPAVRIEKDAWAQFCRAWGQLGLQVSRTLDCPTGFQPVR